MTPKILLVSAWRWFSTARQVMALAEAGFTVDVLCTPRHFVRDIAALHRAYPFHSAAPLRSIRGALRGARPDLVIPCDDLAMLHLHRVYREARGADAPWMRKLLATSLGNPGHHGLIESRRGLADLAREEGIATPETATVRSEAEVRSWVERHGVPAVVKADGTSGGEGVRIVRSPEEALAAYRTLRAPVAGYIVAKRLVVDREANLLWPWLKREQREVSIQSYVRGRDANIAVASWNGEVLASISAEVLRTANAKGPASLVRILPAGEMLEAARKMVRRLGFSGFCGLDFMVDEHGGKTYFIEVNARSTQTCHLRLGAGRDPSAALYAAMTGAPLAERAAMTDKETIAFFPSAWQSNPACEFFKAAYHDVPWEEPVLVRQGVARPSAITYENWVHLVERVRQRRNKDVPLERES